MKHRILNHTFPVGAGAVAVSLALAVSSASALQTTTAVAKPGNPAASPAITRPGQTTLTPAAPVSSKVPASSAEDIRDIRQPRHLPTPIPWAAAAAGVITLAVAAFAAWKWFRNSKLLRMTPPGIALQKLQAARQLMDPDHARDYCFAVSQIIRAYLEAQFRLHAPRLTTEEFLRELVEVRENMLTAHRSLLGDFLQHCDLAKFAGWRYSMPALEVMHNSAIDFVRQTSLDAEQAKTKGQQPVVANATPLPAGAPQA